MKRFSLVVPITLILLVMGVIAVTASVNRGSSPDTATAEPTASAVELTPGTPFDPATGSEIPSIRWLAVLTAILASLILLYFLLRRFSVGRGPRAEKRLVRVVESHLLGPRRALCVVKVMDRVLVLGVTDSNISLLTEIEEGSQLESLESRSRERESSTSRRFSDYLGAILNLSQRETTGTTREVA